MYIASDTPDLILSEKNDNRELRKGLFMFAWQKFQNSPELDKTQYGESYFLLIFCARVHVCNEKRIFSKIIATRVGNQKLISSLVKYFTPQDTKTISLQNNWKFIPGIQYLKISYV